MSTHSIHLQDKKISLNYPYIVFGGNPCGLKNVFDSSMVNEPSGFESLKFYCIYHELCVKAILMSTHNLPILYRRSKRLPLVIVISFLCAGIMINPL